VRAVKQSEALISAESLLRLLRRLEPTAEPVVGLPAQDLHGGLVVPLHEDPGSHILYLVAASAPSSRADGGVRWLRERTELIKGTANATHSTLCTIVFPGSWPDQQTRRRLGPVQVRLVSAVHHLWADRLRIHDTDGNVDTGRRVSLMQRLGGRWDDEEERRYTDPAIEPVVDGDAASIEARDSLLRGQPDIQPGTVTVVYGPGGIGKTFFLRRVTHRMTRAAVADATQGVPLFAELPVLLHEDALEAWISKGGVRLPLIEIEALIQAGVLIPVLDALDELVRGQAREGSRRFLGHLRNASKPAGKVLLSSRDYYLNLDPLVQEELGGTPQLTIGFFSRAGRRRYLQMRTGLNEKDAARWASRLEEQAETTLSGLSEADVESLIGHPLFLDALCQVILEIPAERRVAEADNFQITSPDVFGDIVERVLQREHDKVKPGWDAKFARLMNGEWQDPFMPEVQRSIFRQLVLLAAADSSHMMVERQIDDARYRDLRHGVFTFTSGLPEDASQREALRQIIASVLGPPELVAGVPDEEETRELALDEVAGFLLQHTLADTRPNHPDDLVFATRHRAYFDYLLSEELLAELQATIAAADAAARERFVEWCLRHHIFETQDGTEAPFATCLDFALWHRPAVDKALAALDTLFRPNQVPDDLLTSYVVSLALAVAMRAGVRGHGVRIAERSFAPSESLEIHLIESIVPAVSRVQVSRCTLPTLVVQGITVRDSVLEDCDMFSLSIIDSTLNGVRLDNVSLKSMEWRGTVRLTECWLDLEDLDASSVVVDHGASVILTGCHVSSNVADALEAARRVRPDAVALDYALIQRAPDYTDLSPGRIFINRLMTLVRKHGHNEYGVWEPKLRGLTKATGSTFPQAIQVLREHGAVEMKNEMVCLTSEAERQIFSGKLREGLRPYEDVAEYWDPIVRDLDSVLTT